MTGEPEFVARLCTPFLSVERDVLDRNIAELAHLTAASGMVLRPHAKTHKCLEIARRQLAAGAAGLTVATIGEAEVFADAGVDDLFVAYPLWPGGPRGRRLRALAERVSLRVGVDSVEAAEALGRTLAGTTARLLVELDSGQHRSGVLPGEAGPVAVAAARAGLRVAGVFTFPGHGYRPGASAAAAADEAHALRAGADALARAGLEADVRSGGSTPTAAATDTDAVTELRPGVYVFNDAQQVELGTCDWPRVALTATATVVSRRPGTIVLDAGSKILGADQPAWATGAGRLPDHPGARIVALSEHHATVTIAEADAPGRGETVRVAPNHVCAAVNLVDELIVTAGGRIVDRWAVAARGANS